MQPSDRLPGAGPSRAAAGTGGGETVADVVEELGGGLAQLRVAVLTGFVSFLGGAVSLVATTVTDIVAREWSLSPFQSGMLVSLFFVGFFFGTVAGGGVGDRLGRKLPIVMSFWMLLLSACLCAAAFDVWSLGVFRFLLGFAFGFGQPAQTSMVTETSPSRCRLAFFIVTLAMFYLGELYMGAVMVIDSRTVMNLHWRLLSVLAALPAIPCALLTMFFLEQSPLYLASRGHLEEAMEVVASLRRQNGLPERKVELASHTAFGPPVEVTWARQMETIFGRRLLSTTLIACWLCLCSDGLHYGTMCAFPKAMVRGVAVGGSSTLSLMLGAVSEIGGSIVTFLMVTVPRKKAMFGAFGVEAAALGIFATACEGIGSSAVLALLGFHLTKLANPVCGLIAFLYVSEVYPTSSRALGSSVSMAVGRVGAVLSPNGVELLMAFVDVDAYFWLAAALHAVGMVLIPLLPYETLGQRLEDDDALHAVEGVKKYGGADVADAEEGQ